MFAPLVHLALALQALACVKATMAQQHALCCLNMAVTPSVDRCGSPSASERTWALGNASHLPATESRGLIRLGRPVDAAR